MSPGNTVASRWSAHVASDPGRPVITHYDDATGERTELSGATLDNWVAKTANLVVDSLGLGPGDEAAVWLPPHWQTAAVLLGCWATGLTVAYGEPSAAEAGLAFASVEAVLAGAPATAGDRYALGLAPMGAPLREAPPEGWLDYVSEVRTHGDRYAGAPVAADTVAWLDPGGAAVTQAALLDRARERAARLGIVPGSRVLIDADAYPYPLDWLLAPIAVDATVVLCTHTDLAELASRAEIEKATTVTPTS